MTGSLLEAYKPIIAKEKDEWIFWYGGFPCIIKRLYLYTRSCYVGVGRTHPFYGYTRLDKSDWDKDKPGSMIISVIKGITPDGRALRAGSEPFDGFNLYRWFSFDCCMQGDLIPMDNFPVVGNYKDKTYAIVTTLKLAVSIKDRTKGYLSWLKKNENIGWD